MTSNQDHLSNPQESPNDHHDNLIGEYSKPESDEEILYKMCCNSTRCCQHSSKAKDGKKAKSEDQGSPSRGNRGLISVSYTVYVSSVQPDEITANDLFIRGRCSNLRRHNSEPKPRFIQSYEKVS
jgi:hypothetical protein